MTPCIGPYSPVAAIKRSPSRTLPSDRPCGPPWFGPPSRPSSELRTAVPTQADGDDGHGNLDAGGHEAGRWRPSNLDAGGHEIWTPPDCFADDAVN